MTVKLTSRWMVAGLLSALLMAACGQRLAIQPTATPEPTSTPTPVPTNTPVPTPTAIKKTVVAPTPETSSESSGTASGNGIAVSSLEAAVPDLKSTQSKLTLTLDGTGKDNKVLQGTLDVTMNNNIALKQRELGISGNLLTPLLADQLRGFSARGLSVYALDDQVYASIQTLLSICVKPKASQVNAEQIAAGLSLDTFTRLFAPNGNFPGQLVGDETVNGIPSKHYTLDVQTLKSMAAQRGLKDIDITKGDVWLASQGNYVTKLDVSGSGKLSNIANNSFDGSFSMAMELTGVNNSPEVALPSNCARAIELP